ncbi:DNA primase [Amygdalobacter nucleatus]|uniref:DNA primase n=1 Tax=Amygdalobacter nucleatus TaxID=3029274 RepID=A0A133YEF9_9FIRM|nr:DNA primase [Amygdalobacter nucleatus]KXB41533.1 DNA primase [Amygdalobacter nucleatus]MDF0485628.1 DNA primase [Amygdalobacter nucleatus]
MTEYARSELYQQIKDQIDIVDLVSEYVTLQKKSSNNYFGICPFHQEKTASFSVSASKQIYYCFGCHKGGDCVAFIRDIEHIEWKEALAFLAKRLHIEWKLDTYKESKAEQVEQAKDKRQFLLANLAAKYYYACLQSKYASQVQAYLQSRSLEQKAVQAYGLGAALGSGHGLTNFLLKQHFTKTEMLDSGLVREKNGQLYDLFRNRLIFPIMDRYDRVVAFGGRVLDQSKPKYINSPETPIYVKGQHLYAYNFAKRSNAEEILVVEGYMDAISLLSRGYQQVVACLGTALTNKQAHLLKLLNRQVVLCFDSDQAGQKASHLSLLRLELQGLQPQVLKVKDAKDPDEYVRKFGIDAFQRLVKTAESALTWRINSAFDNARTSNGAFDEVVFFKEAIAILANLRGPINFARGLQEVRKKVASYSEETIKQEVLLYKKSDEYRQFLRNMEYEAKQTQTLPSQVVKLPSSESNVKSTSSIDEQAIRSKTELTAKQNKDLPQPFLNILWLLINDNLLYQECAETLDKEFSKLSTIKDLWLTLKPLLAKNQLDTATLLHLLAFNSVSTKTASEIAKLFMQENEITDKKASHNSLHNNLLLLKCESLQKQINKLSWQIRNKLYASDEEKAKLRQHYQQLNRELAILRR